MLSILLFFPAIAAIGVLLAGERAKLVAFSAAMIEFVLALVLAGGFDPAAGMQFVENSWWVRSLGISYYIGLDGLGLLLVLLTVFLVPLIILASFKHSYEKPGLFYALVLLMQTALIGVFISYDGFLFYVFWELALIPIYLICLMWGGKNRAAITLKFFIYTLAGSLLMLVALIYLWTKTPYPHSFEISRLYETTLSLDEQSWIFWAFFIAFAIKIPVFPFHTWQPDTYTNAPVAGSMLLSGIMLKMGVYGTLRWLLPVVPSAVQEWAPWAIGLCVAGILYASLIAMTQSDFRRLIAYSSIAHVGLIAAGVFSLTSSGLQGGIIQMLSHGVSVVGLFFIADILFRRLNSDEMESMGGIRNMAPVFSTFFLIILLASIALPLTSGFVGEFLILNGLFQYKPLIAGLAGISVILGAVYMLNAFKKINLGTENKEIKSFDKLSRTEWLVLTPLVIMIFWIGIYPSYFLSLAEPAVAEILDRVSRNSLTLNN
ncbi:MAG: NADH-quinone oxidoreductase subunit M [Bacteroidetes bacterium]|nr:MAG: NADH-quinone oxidoreductase subunit M [Bacteroidota bacterium]REK00761.1 MAG: NADH-quinone oxidoreductase subunit M [Bacteroidota bacterium]REK35009.1 MAG: NADH-quinone oxidoreductase subunit M [Bacteroidota bacterium]REK48193.1 MAG: NADH-quinone oxidoreductase subunit M [Bacteroidota bacterium]